MKNLYEVLGVEKSAETGEIRKAFMRLAVRSHPDKNPGDEKAAETFRSQKRAYDILMDPLRRKRYDKAGSIGDGETFEAAYERYKAVDITVEDIEEFVGGYRFSEAEESDLIAFVKSQKGDVSRILENIIGSEDDDVDRFLTFITKAFQEKRLPKKFKRTFLASKENVLSLADLEKGEDLESEDESDDDDDDDDLDDLIAKGDEEESEDSDSDSDVEKKVDLEPPPTAFKRREPK